MKKCVYAGTFSPIHIGHLSVIKKCLKMFDKVVVAFAQNPQKEKSEIYSNVDKLRNYYKDDSRIKIVVWEGAIVDLLKKENTNIYVRGVRNVADFNYELECFYANKTISKNLIEIFIPCEQDKIHISSTLIRELKRLNKPYKKYLIQKESDKQ